MKVDGRFLAIIGVFCLLMGIAYIVFTSMAQIPEEGGFAMLLGAAGLGFLPGAYYLWWDKRMKPLPGDVPDADTATSAGTIDAFAASSIWPFIFGMGAMFAALTFVFGLWLAPIAAGLILSAAIGFTVESRRGGTV